jgi:arabinogalactan oligomer / maltooligosaccharide transport system substrate-binding protein
MKMGRKGFLLLALLVSITMILSACGPQRTAPTSSKSGGTSTATKKDKAPAKPASLTMWVNADDTQAKTIQAMTDKYTAKTGIKVTLTKINMLDQQKKLSVVGPQGKGPDLFFQPQDRIGDLVTQGLVAPIDSYVTQSELSGYSEPALHAVTMTYKEPTLGDTSAKSHLYGFPAVTETYTLFYNKDLVKNPPKTFDELKTTAKSLTDASKKKYGFVFEGNNFYYDFPFIAADGGYIFGGKAGNLDTKDIGVNSAGTVKGFKVLQSFFTEGLIPTSVNADVVNGLFKDGSAAMVINGPWAIADYKKALGDKLATAPIPTIDGKPAVSFSGVKSWLISSYSKNQYWAADLAKFITNDENSKYYFDNAGELVPRPAVLSNLTDPVYQGFGEQLKNSEPMPNIPEMSQVWTPMNNALQFMAKGKDLQKVLDDAKKQIDQGIKASKQ